MIVGDDTHDEHLLWQRSAAAGARRSPDAWATRFEWSQFPGIGPGAEVFGSVSGTRLLEVGCGTGDNAAHLTRLGASVHGIDVAPANVAEAYRRYGTAVGLTFTVSSAEEYLRTSTDVFDGVYSVFGALSFVDPSLLLPLVRRRLTQQGRLWFSVRHTDWRRTGESTPWGSVRLVRQELPAGGFVRRYDLDRCAWRRELRRAGFVIEHATEIVAVDGEAPGPCCLLFTCRCDRSELGQAALNGPGVERPPSGH